jgi:hypothetical protein
MAMKILLFLLSCSCAFVSCSKDDSSAPQTDACTAGNNFSFPANATKFSVSLYTDCQTVSNGQEFSLKVVLYNVSDLFGFASEILLPTDKVQFVSAAAGGAFQPSSDVIRVNTLVSGSSIYACGATYTSLSTYRTNGSGVVMKLRLRATATGTALFTINRNRLELKRSDGTPITNFDGMQVEDASVVIQ